MADSSKYVPLFEEAYTATTALTDAQFGQLMRSVLANGFYGTPYNGTDPMISMPYAFISGQVSRVLEKLSDKRKAGAAGGSRTKKQASQNEEALLKQCLSSAKAEEEPVKAESNLAKAPVNSALAEVNPALAEVKSALAEVEPALAETNSALAEVKSAKAPIQSNPIQSSPIQSNPYIYKGSKEEEKGVWGENKPCTPSSLPVEEESDDFLRFALIYPRMGKRADAWAVFRQHQNPSGLIEAARAVQAAWVRGEFQTVPTAADWISGAVPVIKEDAP